MYKIILFHFMDLGYLRKTIHKENFIVLILDLLGRIAIVRGDAPHKLKLPHVRTGSFPKHLVMAPKPMKGDFCLQAYRQTRLYRIY